MPGVYRIFIPGIFCLLLLQGCGPKHAWSLNQVPSTGSEFASCKLNHAPKYPGQEIELEFLRINNDVELFLVIRGQPIPSDPTNPKETALTITTDSATVHAFVFRHSGGQKFAVPSETRTLIVQSLQEGRKITLSLPGYSCSIDPLGFTASYEHFLKNPFMENPFHLPF